MCVNTTVLRHAYLHSGKEMLRFPWSISIPHISLGALYEGFYLLKWNEYHFFLLEGYQTGNPESVISVQVDVAAKTCARADAKASFVFCWAFMRISEV